MVPRASHRSSMARTSILPLLSLGAALLLLLLLGASPAATARSSSSSASRRGREARGLATAATASSSTAGGATAAAAAATLDAADRPRVVLAVFGDSLSDTGNTLQAGRVPQSDLYFEGRYSNGPVWVDYLAAAVANTTQLTVRNYAYGGAAACPANGVASRYPFIRDLPQQTADFLTDATSGNLLAVASSSAQQQQQQQQQLGGGGERRLVPVNVIGVNDVRGLLIQALAAGAFPGAAAASALVTSVTACRIAWARELLAAGEAVWRSQRGPARVLVFLPVARLDLAPAVPEPVKPQLKALTEAINGALAAAVAALSTELAAAPVGSSSRGAQLLLLPESSEQLLGAVQPAFTNPAPCFLHPVDALEVVPGITPCTDPDARPFYDQLHPSTRFHAALALAGILPALQQAGLLV